MADLLDEAFENPKGIAIRITGPPCAGKSTLINVLIAEWRSQGKTVAVLAVDPSSKATGGALLGDRVRIRIDPNDDGIFIRSIAARGRLGGLADIVYPAAALLRALGRPPESATLEDLRLFRLHLIDSTLGVASVNFTMQALGFSSASRSTGPNFSRRYSGFK